MKKSKLDSHLNQSGKILVVGATGGSGRATVEHLVGLGHQVTAFSRSASSHFEQSRLLTPFNGDALQASDVDRAVEGHDAVVVTLGISENPLRVRFLGSKATADNVRSAGTRNVIDSMRRHGIDRLVVQSSYGVGETRNSLGMLDQLFFTLLLKPQIADTEIQEQLVRASDIDWVIAQPVHLTDSEVGSDEPFVSTDGQTRATKVARKSVARFLARAVLQSDYIGRSVAVSG
jgi:uncharacterized protein YbjT (DUF2867 family)